MGDPSSWWWEGRGYCSLARPQLWQLQGWRWHLWQAQWAHEKGMMAAGMPVWLALPRGHQSCCRQVCLSRPDRQSWSVGQLEANAHPLVSIPMWQVLNTSVNGVSGVQTTGQCMPEFCAFDAAGHAKWCMITLFSVSECKQTCFCCSPLKLPHLRSLGCSIQRQLELQVLHEQRPCELPQQLPRWLPQRQLLLQLLWELLRLHL